MRELASGAAIILVPPLVSTLCALAWGQASQSRAHSSTGQAVTVVELFTSEGCSSCPPADALLRRIAGRTEDGKQIIALSEHVTYWNRLGWNDPYSSETYTARQNVYADRFHLDSVYTPQIVVNGREQVLGSDEAAVLDAVRRQPAQAEVSLHILAVATQNRSVRVEFTFGDEANSDIDLFGALVDDMDVSQVSRGENSGRTLTHVNVVRGLARLGKVKHSGRLQIVLSLPIESGKQLETPRHVLLLAQSSNQGDILTADAAEIPAAPQAK